MKISVFLILLTSLFTLASSQYKTEYGHDISPTDTIFTLNLFINIVYDLCDTCDPCSYSTPNWEPGDTSILNDNPPPYLAKFIDREFDPKEIHGSFTRRFAEASFNKFIILGDFINVNLPQSRITPVYTGSGFSQIQLVNAAITIINEKGGLVTHYAHDSIQHYDGHLNEGPDFELKKPGSPNGKIDLLQIFVRNSTNQFGRLQAGGNARVGMRKSLLLNGIPYTFDKTTIQGAIRNMDLSDPQSQPAEVHEMAHHILGMTNSAHMGGGSPVNVGNLVTLEHNTGGWSLLGSANSSLISCNGYERWRLNWRGPDNQEHRIACQGRNSDVVREVNQAQIFYLRDFVTTGDAVRIEIPYVDSGALSQFIWLENHQIHRNGNRMDYPRYWKRDCRSDGTPGIYAYYQVGKDILEGSSIKNRKGTGEMLPFLTDHLVPISAEGRWDITFTDETERMCINGHIKPVQQYVHENPLSGYNDLSSHFFDPDSINVLNWREHSTGIMTKKKDGNIHDSLSSSGDAFDAFTNNVSMSIGTNPSSSSLVTYHHTRTNSGTISRGTGFIDNRRIHLSGLRINIIEQTDGIMCVNISWNSYDVENSVRWTGDIVLHETVNLLSGNKITFDQNFTPNKHIRDTITGLFAGTTYFTCLENSTFVMQPSSEVELRNLSSFILNAGSRMEINDSSIFMVGNGSTLVIMQGAEIVIRNSGRIVVKDEAYICIEPDANIVLRDEESTIYLGTEFISGVNKKVLQKYRCTLDAAAISASGNGEVKQFKN